MKLSDVAPFVDDVEVHTSCGRHDGHADVRGQLGERLDDAVDLDALGPQVLLVVLVANLALPADGLFIDPCRPGLGPRAPVPGSCPGGTGPCPW